MCVTASQVEHSLFRDSLVIIAHAQDQHAITTAHFVAHEGLGLVRQAAQTANGRETVGASEVAVAHSPEVAVVNEHQATIGSVAEVAYVAVHCKAHALDVERCFHRLVVTIKVRLVDYWGTASADLHEAETVGP